MKRVEILIADDDANVRETFKDLVVDYKKDLAKHRRDDHLGMLFNNDYKIYYDEAENGLELQDKISSRLDEHPSQYFVSFVDEDMPVKRGTDAIAGVTELLYSINRKNSDTGNRDVDRPKVKLVSYTQKHDIDISEGIAKDSGASLFLRKTGLDDFYEEMIGIIEHMVLDLTNLEYFTPSNVSRRAVLKSISGEAGDAIKCFKEYLKFRYRKEVLTEAIPTDYYNNAWMFPDFADFFSVPLCMYADVSEKPRLVGCARLIFPSMQNKATMLMEDLLDLFAGSLPALKGDFKRPVSDTVRLDKYYIDRSFIGYDIATELMKYSIAYSRVLGMKNLTWPLSQDLLPLAKRFGFRAGDSLAGDRVRADLNLASPDESKIQIGPVIDQIGDGSGQIELKLVPQLN